MEKDLMYISFLKLHETEHLGQMISAPASYMGEPCFKARPKTGNYDSSFSLLFFRPFSR
jgi:hypothetical protein